MLSVFLGCVFSTIEVLNDHWAFKTLTEERQRDSETQFWKQFGYIKGMGAIDTFVDLILTKVIISQYSILIFVKLLPLLMFSIFILSDLIFLICFFEEARALADGNDPDEIRTSENPDQAHPIVGVANQVQQIQSGSDQDETAEEFLNRYLVKEENMYVMLVEKRKTASLKYVSVSISLREENIFKEYLSFVQPALLKPGALVLSNFLLTTTGTKLENMSVIQRFLKKARDLTIDTCDCHPQQTYFGRHINHKAKEDSPNLKLRLLVVNDIKRPFLIATRDIWAGEELKFDYGLRPSDFHEGHEQAFFLPEARKCRKEVANKIEEKRQTETSVHRQGAQNRQRCMIQKTPRSHQGPRNQQ
ncbi:hypothetical protein QYM36_019735, partial [Artemia franciscana]